MRTRSPGPAGRRLLASLRERPSLAYRIEGEAQVRPASSGGDVEHAPDSGVSGGLGEPEAGTIQPLGR